MKKLLEFIWELIAPPLIFIISIFIGIIMFIWIFTFFGLLIIFCPTEFPTPTWIKWFIFIFDGLCLIILLYEKIKEAYKKVYKN